MPHQNGPITVGLLFLIIVSSFFFLGSSVNKITGMATSGSCPARIEAVLDKQHYNVNDVLTFTISIWDTNEDPMPNQLFYINKSVNGVYKWTRTYPTGSNGIYVFRGTVTSESIGDDTYLTYVNVAGCPYIFFTDYFDVGTASTTTTTSTTIPRSTTTTTTIPSGGAPTTTTTTTTSTTTTRPPITTPAESFDYGLNGYVSIMQGWNYYFECRPIQCDAKYPGYCYEYPDMYGMSYEARCATGWNLVKVLSVPGRSGMCSDYKIVYSCYKAPTNFCGNSIKEAVETCDDGNNINDSGSCSSDCKRINYFNLASFPIIRCDNNWNYNEADVNNNEVNVNQVCKEKGFTKAARFVYTTQFTGRTVRCNWNGNNWEYYPNSGDGYITDLWCE